MQAQRTMRNRKEEKQVGLLVRMEQWSLGSVQ